MYRNLNAERTRKGLTWKELAKACGVNYNTLTNKVSAGGEFTLAQAVALRNALGVDMPLEQLFMWEEKDGAARAK